MNDNKAQRTLLNLIEEVRRYEHAPLALKEAINIVHERGFTPRVLRLVREVELANPDCDWDYVQTIDEALQLIDTD